MVRQAMTRSDMTRMEAPECPETSTMVESPVSRLLSFLRRRPSGNKGTPLYNLGILARYILSRVELPHDLYDGSNRLSNDRCGSADIQGV